MGCQIPLRSAPEKPLVGYWYTVKKGDTIEHLKSEHGIDPTDLRELNGLEKDATLKVGQQLFVFGIERKRKSAKPKSTTVRASKNAKRSRQLLPQNRKWIWPVRGARLTSTFGPRGNRPHKGIDLAAKIGTPIFATADGVVIYSGSRQRGYGNLVIIKHPDEYVSVYAHNRRNLVDEGDKVRQGFQIAELGNSGRSTGPHLHFEIRRKGKPLDPLTLLGKKP